MDYVANKSFLSLDMGWDNNFRPGFFVGAAVQDGYATQGRSEVGDSVASFNYVARYQNGSTERATLLALTSGTAVIGLANGTNDTFSGTWQQMAFKVVEIGRCRRHHHRGRDRRTHVQQYERRFQRRHQIQHGQNLPVRKTPWKREIKKTSFDASKEFVVPILSGGEKRCSVRFPTDEEWCGWARRQRSVRRVLGRGKSQTEEIGLGEVNAELFGKIRLDKDGPVFDEAEAGAVIGKLERAAVVATRRL